MSNRKIVGPRMEPLRYKSFKAIMLALGAWIIEFLIQNIYKCPNFAN